MTFGYYSFLYKNILFLNNIFFSKIILLFSFKIDSTYNPDQNPGSGSKFNVFGSPTLSAKGVFPLSDPAGCGPHAAWPGQHFSALTRQKYCTAITLISHNPPSFIFQLFLKSPRNSYFCHSRAPRLGCCTKSQPDPPDIRPGMGWQLLYIYSIIMF